MELLVQLITAGTPPGLVLEQAPPRFRLTDLARLESILESLARSWEHGYIFLDRKAGNGPLVVTDVQLDSGANTGRTRKRKRSVDEDADSAAGDVPDASFELEEEVASPGRPVPRFPNLSNELKEVYALLQRSTAKGRLLAEQVRDPTHGERRNVPDYLSVSLGRRLRSRVPLHYESRLREGPRSHPPGGPLIDEIRTPSRHRLLPRPLPSHSQATHGSEPRPLLLPEHMLL